MEKLSFAKVAATTKSDSANRNPNDGNNTQPKSSQPGTGGPVPGAVVIVDGSGSNATRRQLANAAQVDDTICGLKKMQINAPVPNLVVGGGSTGSIEAPQAVMSRASGSDDSHPADSNSEIDTKPASLDGKSITSGTTFALDEKESLRPDDSASVKAAEDDDTGSLIAGSRLGSEAAARARGIVVGDMSQSRQAGSMSGVPHQTAGILTPQSASSEPPTDPSTADALNVIYRQAPDDKLLDALASPKDRIFLLRLEKDVVDFVQNSKEPYMDLPPSNSFCRMLTHKLADYYHMTHSYEPHIGSVRIFRTPFCRVPPSLALMVPPVAASTSSTPPPAVLPRKIMRRGQGEDSVPVSASASKPSSEAGSDAKDAREKQMQANSKLSREQREEMYKLARERIFGSSEENSTVDNDGVTEMSRSSSISNTRSNASKRGKLGKQRRDDSDSFDSRHHYTPYWGHQQQTWIPQAQQQPQWIGPNTQAGGQPPAMYGQQHPMYAQPDASYPMAPGPPQVAGYAGYPMQQHQPVQPYYRPSAGAGPSYGSPMAAPVAAAPPQNWQPGYGQPPVYQGRGQGPPPPPGAHHGIPYAYGQLPANANPHDPKSQHPIPGSYTRNQPFNPQTQSFTPNTGMMPGQAPQPPFTAPGSHHSSPQIGSPHLAYTGYQTGPPYAGPYAMARQGSSSSIPSYHMPPQGTPPHGAIPTAPQHMGQPVHQQSPVPSRPQQAQGSGNQAYSHLPTYGNPATLPQKPASGI